MRRLAGLLLIVGSVLFLDAAFEPVMYAVFSGTSDTARVYAITTDRFAWNVAAAKMALGPLLAALALVPLARHVQRFGRPDASRLGYLAAAVSLVAAGIAVGGAFGRIRETAEAIIYDAPEWPFTIAYFFEPLTMLGLVLAALALGRAGYPRGMTRSLLIPAALLAGLALIGYPPLLSYFVTLWFGFVLVVAPDREAGSQPAAG